MIMGSFDRQVAIKNDYIHFYAPGDEIFDCIVENAMGSYKGMCTALAAESSVNWKGFIYTYSIEPNSCNKNAGAIVSAIKTANQIKETTDTQELLLKFSKDPVFALSDFAKLLTLTNSDLVIAKQEVANRMNNVISAGGGNNTDQYNTDKENLQECKKIIAEVK